MGDSVADLLWAPLILVWARKPQVRFTHRTGEGFALAGMVLLAGLMTFFNDLPFVPQSVSPFYQAGLLLMVLLWAALRFGQRGAATAAFSISKWRSRQRCWDTGHSFRRG